MNNIIGIVLKLSLAGLCVSAFPQDTSKTIDGRGRSGSQQEVELVEFMNARTDILVAENASKDLIGPRIDLETFQIMQNALKTNEIMVQGRLRSCPDCRGPAGVRQVDNP